MLIAALVASGALFIISYSLPTSDESLEIPTYVEKVSSYPFDHKLIGEGALALQNEIGGVPFPDLSEEVHVLSWSSRPDIPREEMKILLGLHGNKEIIQATPSQPLYLSCNDRELHFSQEKTPLWIRPNFDEMGNISFEIGMKLISNEGKNLIHEVRTFKKEVETPFKRIDDILDQGLAKGVRCLKEGKWWGPDQLYNRYGGGEYSPYKGVERLELEGKKILFAQEGKTFIWRNEMWEENGETKGAVMARIKEITPYKMEVEVWDKSGLESVLLTFNRERLLANALRMEDFFTRIRQRTASRVACRIENRSVLLKKDDWIIHTAAGWHIIKTASEIEAVLNFDMEGELFVFDGLEKIDGKQVFCGVLFDPMRVAAQSVKLPVMQMKASSQKNKIHRTTTRKLEPIDED